MSRLEEERAHVHTAGSSQCEVRVNVGFWTITETVGHLIRHWKAIFSLLALLDFWIYWNTDDTVKSQDSH